MFVIFLYHTGIHTFLPEGIVRVGGRSNSDILKRFTLRELTRSQKHYLPGHLRTAYNQVSWCEELSYDYCTLTV